ncbi:hypothetical protein DU53_05800 [Kosmotoga sp. DU53]|nr:hypothetical protein DU53_05800 [Kosmotoga sp. DU53]
MPSIEGIAVQLKQHIEQQQMETPILIAHSMGGLISREYIRQDISEANVKAVITIGTPHTGASIADKLTWTIFLGITDAAIVTPPAVDPYELGPAMRSAALGVIIAMALAWLLLFLRINAGISLLVSGVSPAMLVAAGLGVFILVLGAILSMNTPTTMKEMIPGSTFLERLADTNLPANGEEGTIYYASIYGEQKKITELLETMSQDSTEVGENLKFTENMCETLSVSYLVTGAWYMATSFWNIHRFCIGALYVAGGGYLNPDYGIQFAWDNVVVGSNESDGVVPVSSQIFPEDVVSPGARYIEPKPAPDANHLTETDPDTEVGQRLMDIIDEILRNQQ